MQTIYYTTTNFVRHTGNVVDLGEYRRKLALAQEGSLAPKPQAEEAYDFAFAVEDEAPSWEPRLVEQPRPRRSACREQRAWVLDACASLGVLVMTLTFTLHVLL